MKVLKILVPIVIFTFICINCDGGGSNPPSAKFNLKGSAVEPDSSRGVARKGNPTSLKVGLYAVWLSKNTDCSDPILVKEYTNAVVKDFVQNPTVLSGNIEDGEYKCMAVKMVDVIEFIADEDGCNEFSTCYAGVTNKMDLNRDDSATFIDINGNEVEGAGTLLVPVYGVSYFYFSTTPQHVIDNHGVSPHHAFEMKSAITTPDTVTLYFDFKNRITDEDVDENGTPDVCTLDSPNSVGVF